MFNQKKSINVKILIKDITVSNSTTLVRLHLDKVSPNLLTRFLKAEPVPEESDTLMYRSDERSRVEDLGANGERPGWTCLNWWGESVPRESFYSWMGGLVGLVSSYKTRHRLHFQFAAPATELIRNTRIPTTFHKTWSVYYLSVAIFLVVSERGTILAVLYKVLRDPLCGILSTLRRYLHHAHGSIKVYRKPLVAGVVPGTPGSHTGTCSAEV